MPFLRKSIHNLIVDFVLENVLKQDFIFNGADSKGLMPFYYGFFYCRKEADFTNEELY